MKKLPLKPRYSPHLDKMIFLMATTYLIIVCSWLFKQNQSVTSSSLPNHRQENSIIPSPQEKPPAENPAPPPSEMTFQPSEIQPLPEVPEIELVTSATKISPLPILAPPPLPKALNLPAPPPLTISEEKTPQPEKITIPPPPTINAKITSQFPPSLNSVPTLEDSDSANTLNERNSTETKEKNNSLIGVLQLSDQNNLALFNINNLTERVPIGANIPGTNWVVVSINKNEVVINRQDQFLSLRVGEKF